MADEQTTEQPAQTATTAGAVFTITADRKDNTVDAALVQSTDVSTSQQEVEELFAAAISMNPQVFGSSLTITRDQFDTYLHAKIGETVTLPAILDIGKTDEALADHESCGPNGVEYSHNDIAYLMSNGYSKEQAINVLSQDAKYTTSQDVAKTVQSSSTSAAVSEKLTAARDAVAKSQNDSAPTATAVSSRIEVLSAKITAGTITAAEYSEYSSLVDMSSASTSTPTVVPTSTDITN